MADQVVTLAYRGRVALITLNNPKQLNALTQNQFFQLSQLLREVAKRDDVFITVLAAKGRFFCAGANVSDRAPDPDPKDLWNHYLKDFAANNLNLTQAFYTHPKILVTALNGPVVGIAAALVGFSDFIYAAPHTYLLTPFTSLGLLAEGGASRSFVTRMGIAKANEALLMGKRIGAKELLACGFVNEIFEIQPGEDGKFLERVLKEVEDRLGEHLVSENLLKIKALVRKPEMDLLNSSVVDEVMQGMELYMRGIPQEGFRSVASGKRRHKL